MDRNKEKQRKAQNESYLRNKDKIRETQRRRKKITKKKLDEFKALKGCLICGENEPACLVFHHTNGEDKDMGISKLQSMNYLFESERMQKEIAKCVVVCANCHRKIHAGITGEHLIEN